jgi:3-polyprenyl-4-hydroxybenzoate decarboxylase
LTDPHPPHDLEVSANADFVIEGHVDPPSHCDVKIGGASVKLFPPIFKVNFPD